MLLPLILGLVLVNHCSGGRSKRGGTAETVDGNGPIIITRTGDTGDDNGPIIITCRPETGDDNGGVYCETVILCISNQCKTSPYLTADADTPA